MGRVRWSVVYAGAPDYKCLVDDNIGLTLILGITEIIRSIDNTRLGY